MKRTDQYLYLANGRLHRSLFGAINEKGEVKIVKDNQVLTRMNEKQAKALGNIARKITVSYTHLTLPTILLV